MALVVVVAVLGPSSKAGAVVAPRYLRQWTLPGGGGSGTVAVTQSDEVLAPDGSVVDVLTATGQLIRTFGTAGNGYANGVAVDNQGHVYVVYSSPDRVEVYDSSFTFIRRIGAGVLSSPWAVAVDASGNVYVSDQDNHRVVVFTSSGRFLREWGTFGDPVGVGISGDDVYVADGQMDHVYVADTPGGYEATFGRRGSGPGRFDGPTGVAVRNGSVYVADSNNSRVEIFDASGNFQAQFGSGQLIEPSAVAVDGQGNIYVTDFSTSLMTVFGT
jgi:sugar lactone lactonase YvrE